MTRVASINLGHFLPMSHTALARKYRPTSFSDLVGQEHVAAGLSGAVARDRVAHAYLLTGPRGVGKTTAARVLAMALNCPNRTDAGEPCTECDSCQRIWAGSTNLDVVEIDAASNRGVDDARELRERAMYAASSADGFKVYIVDEAHMLTREAWNALLKILEEPPPRVVFVFATTEPQKIANTAAPVMSRVQRFDFRRIGPSAISRRLADVVKAEGVEAEDDALDALARIADGGMRDALSLLDQVIAFGTGSVTLATVQESLGLVSDDLYGELVDIIVEHREEDVFPFVTRLVDSGADLSEFVSGAGDTLRAILQIQTGAEATDVSSQLAERLKERAGDLEVGDTLRMVRLLQESEESIRRSNNVRLYVEALLMQWTVMDRTVDIAEVLSGAVPSRPEGRQKGGSGRSVGASTAAKPKTSPPRSGGAPKGGDGESDSRSSAPARNKTPAAPKVEPPAREEIPDRPASSLTQEELKGAWKVVLGSVGKKSMVLKSALDVATPRMGEPGVVELVLDGEGEAHAEGLRRGARQIAEAISAVTGATPDVEVVAGQLDEPVSQEVPEPGSGKRLDRRTDAEERLKTYRSKDPALDAAAEALDLELLD